MVGVVKKRQRLKIAKVILIVADKSLLHPYKTNEMFKHIKTP